MLCMCAALIAGCGGKAEEQSEGLKEYAIDGVGRFYLPEGFEVESGVSEEGLPMHYAGMTKDSLYVGASRFGVDAYEAAGVPLPENLDDYSTRDGVRANLPEDAEFTRDQYDNLYVKFTENGTTQYQYLKQGKDAFGAMVIICPEGEEDDETFALWASKAVLE